MFQKQGENILEPSLTNHQCGAAVGREVLLDDVPQTIEKVRISLSVRLFLSGWRKLLGVGWVRDNAIGRFVELELLKLAFHQAIGLRLQFCLFYQEALTFTGFGFARLFLKMFCFCYVSASLLVVFQQ